MFSTKITLLTLLFCSYVCANMAPSYPEPGTVWKTGNTYEITWVNDKHAPSIARAWKNFKIDFMTGDNVNQKFLKNVATGLDGTKIKSFNWTAPEVEPHAAIYFLMFSNGKGQNAWTTRFGITGQDGKLVKPEKSVQPDGAKIPWGIGKVVESNGDVSKGTNTATAINPTSSALPSTVEVNDAVASIPVSSGSMKMNLPSFVLFAFILIINTFLYLL
ncbi:MAG: hypothetical protein EXX96DRAFT_578890 [Benjaminiella poitrasii]|nr:MAG: hypothetical protein EXX96DRAFT_578890 [Benjaminiella poitrasii]